MPIQPLSYKLGDWLPDNPDLVNPAFPPQMAAYFSGGLITLNTAQNTIWRDGAYRPFYPLSGSNPLPAACIGAVSCYDTAGNTHIFAGTATNLYKWSGTAWTNVSKTGGYTAARWSFQQFGDCLDASDYNDPMQTINITNGLQFADLDTNTTTDLVPKAKVLGVIRDFLVAGNTNDATNGVVPYRVQWSALSIDGSWPIPSTQLAYSFQAGAQTLYSEYGPVQYIGDGEQFGLIFQSNGIVRVTYMGGAQVFEFITYEKRRGAIGQNAVAKVGENYYFLAPDGFFVTDGSSVKPLGVGKFDKWFFANANSSTLSNVIATVDTQAKCIYFAFQSTNGTALDSLLIYNYVDQKATYCLQNAQWYFQMLNNNNWTIGAFDTSNNYGLFTGTAGTATWTTQDFQINPGGRGFVNGIRPLCEGTAVVAVGVRNSLADSSALSPYANVNIRSNMVPFRAEGRFHRFSIQAAGAFTDAIGFSVYQMPSGQI